MRYQIFLFLRWAGRLVYKACSWLSNKVYQVPTTTKKVSLGTWKPVIDTKPGTVLGAKELLADSYDPKRQFRWMLAVEGIPAFVVNTCRRPILSRNGRINHPSTLEASFYDPVVPSTSHAMWDWWKSQTKKNAVLTLLDPVGIVVEEWKFSGVYPEYIDFGELNYSNADPVKIELIAAFDSVELTNERTEKGL